MIALTRQRGVVDVVERLTNSFDRGADIAMFMSALQLIMRVVEIPNSGNLLKTVGTVRLRWCCRPRLSIQVR